MRDVIEELDQIAGEEVPVYIEYIGKEVAIFLPNVCIESAFFSQGILNIELEDGHFAFNVTGFRKHVDEQSLVLLKNEEESMLKIYEIIK